MDEGEPERRALPATPAFAAAALLALWVVMLTLGGGAVDGQLLKLLYAHGHSVVTPAATAITRLGDAVVLITIAVAAALFMLWRGSPWLGLAIIAVSLAGRLVISAQKHGVARIRPSDHEHLVIVSNPSFPSGHAGNSMIVFLTIALVASAGTAWTRTAVALAVALSLLVGLSRVVLGVHWPSDVFGGWAFGLLWVLVAMPLAQRVPRR